MNLGQNMLAKIYWPKSRSRIQRE